MSDNYQNENNSTATIKPTIQKHAIKNINRPQTEGYQKDEPIEQNPPSQTKLSLNSNKPSLNLSASVYIPKSVSSSNSNTNQTTIAAEKPIQSPANSANQNNLLNPNTQPFTPKMNNFNSNMNLNNQMNSIPAQNYNMGQSKYLFD